MKLPRRLILPASICALALLVAAGAGLAADKPTERSFGVPKPGSRVLTRAELRDCLGRRDSIRAAREATVQQQAQLAKDKDEIARRGTELQARLAALDRTSQAEVDAYNADAAARDRLIDAYDAATPLFNAKVEALTAEQATFASSCENRRYEEADEQALQRRR